MLRQLTFNQLKGWNDNIPKNIGMRDFIYNPANKIAYFKNVANASNLVYIGESDKVRLWLESDKYNKEQIWDPMIVTPGTVHVPLYKSHVQKAIRRKLTVPAIQGVLALLYEDANAILRRLAIIAIEDVCLVYGYSVIVWLMMSQKYRKLTYSDVNTIVEFVIGLCDIDTVFKNTKTTVKQRPELSAIPNPERSELLSLYHRARFGGLPGDIKMLQNAISYYYEHRRFIVKNKAKNEYDIMSLKLNIPIIPESIDFHPFPYLLTKISTNVNATPEQIKKMIWDAESAVNKRKINTIKQSKITKKQQLWTNVKLRLDNERVFVKDNILQDVI